MTVRRRTRRSAAAASAGNGPQSPARREVLALGLAAAGAAICVPAWSVARRPERARASLSEIGPLLGPDENGVLLPRGYRSRIVARSGTAPVAGGSFLWHAAPDGGACFPAPRGGWVYVSNSELPLRRGGAGALRFSKAGDLLDSYRILSGTTFNCAGGPTPWGTWLSCEEHESGLVWECDPLGGRAAVPLPALGAFTHEAVAVDPLHGQLYLTEDLPDGRFYRFTPSKAREGRLDLEHGALEAMENAGAGAPVQWHRVGDPSGKSQAIRYQAAQSSAFKGGEGCWYAGGRVYFTTKGDWRVWSLDVDSQRLRVLYDGRARMHAVLTGVDNVTGTPGGEILVAEDNGDMQIVALNDEGLAAPIVQISGHARSEVAGPAFNPAGTRLYFSSQRGAAGRSEDGVTYEISGPFAGQ